MGNTDRVIRLIVAALLIGLFVSHRVTGTMGLVFVILAGIFMLTSLSAYCPLYSLFKIQTKRKT